ncbi:MAG: ABC transporter ATP-binding protein [bacterium]|nr:ABC transporter ATP-binding protein [bacterium]
MMLEVSDCSVQIQQQKILSNISFSTVADENLSIIGPSGAGKTTLLRCIAGLQKYSGSIIIDSKAINELPIHERNFGFVDQQLNLFPHLTIYENIAYPLRVRKMPKGEIKQRVSHIMERFNILQYKKKLPQELSGGEQQRVAFARTLVYKPRLLLLDEPFGSLDTMLRYELASWLREILQKNNTLTLFVTHDIKEAKFFSKRSMVLHEGKKIGHGTWPALETYNNSTIQRMLKEPF